MSIDMSGPGPLLLLWSGGLDSTLCLYEALRQGREVRTHHIHLVNKEGRSAFEARAIERITAWLHDQGLTNFRHTESVTDFGDLNYRVVDVKIWAWWAGVILTGEKDITQIALPTHRDAFTNAWMRRRQSYIREQMPALSGPAGRVHEWTKPIAHMTKKQIVEAIPAPLLELCWWCRTPVNGEPCHECLTCKQVDAALGFEAVEAPVSDVDVTETVPDAVEPGAVEAPRGNASRAVWAEYARYLGLAVPEGATRNEIRDAIARG